MIYFFFFNDTATTEIYTLSLHDALPILVAIRPETREVVIGRGDELFGHTVALAEVNWLAQPLAPVQDRKSTRLNSSHLVISYAVFCLKKKIHSLFHIRHMLLHTDIAPHL